MGKTICTVYNDTDETQTLYTFNKADGLRLRPYGEYVVEPAQSQSVSAGDGRALILATNKFNKGHHLLIENGRKGEPVLFSDILKAPPNPWAVPCSIAAGAGIFVGSAAIAAGAVVGASVAAGAVLAESVCASVFAADVAATAAGVAVATGATTTGAVTVWAKKIVKEDQNSEKSIAGNEDDAKEELLEDEIEGN